MMESVGAPSQGQYQKWCKLLIAVAAGIATSGGVATAEGTLERALKESKVRIAIANAQPYAGVEPDGRPSGAAPDVAIAVLKLMGIKDVEATIVDYGAMIPGLQSNRFDIVTAGLNLNPQRCSAVIFSEPDVCSTWSMAVKKGNPLKLRSIADIAANPNVKVSVCGGCIEQKMLLDGGVKPEQIVVANDEQTSFELLTSGRIDAYPYPTSSINALMAKSGDAGVEMTGLLPDASASCAGAAFRQSDKDFRDAYDVALLQLKESGDFDTILSRYGFAAEPAKTMTREGLCQAPN